MSALGTCKDEVGPSCKTLEGFIVHSKDWNCLLFGVESFISLHTWDARVVHYRC